MCDICHAEQVSYTMVSHTGTGWTERHDVCADYAVDRPIEMLREVV